jgi:hypothetical protein
MHQKDKLRSSNPECVPVLDGPPLGGNAVDEGSIEAVQVDHLVAAIPRFNAAVMARDRTLWQTEPIRFIAANGDAVVDEMPDCS